MDGPIMNKELWMNPPKLNKKHNMTPSEKAQELYLKFYGVPLYIKTVKQCCHILIDEILVADYFMMTEKQEKFWEEVKEEINKL